MHIGNELLFVERLEVTILARSDCLNAGVLIESANRERSAVMYHTKPGVRIGKGHDVYIFI